MDDKARQEIIDDLETMFGEYMAGGFGELEGYLRDEDGKKDILDGMMGMGEDKSLLL